MDLHLESKIVLVTGSTNMVAYICSPLSSATNGAALLVDAGALRGTV